MSVLVIFFGILQVLGGGIALMSDDGQTGGVIAIGFGFLCIGLGGLIDQAAKISDILRQRS